MMKIKNIYRMLSFAIIGSAMVLMSVSTVYGLGIDEYIADIHDEYRNDDNYWDIVKDAVKNFDEQTLVEQREDFENHYKYLSKHLTELEKKPQENEQYINHTKEDMQRFKKYIGMLKSEQSRREITSESEEDGNGGEPEKFEDIPIDSSSTSTQANVSVTAEAPASSGAGPVITPDVPTNITQTVTQNNNGTITQETTSNSVQSSGGIGTGETSAESGNNVKTDDAQTENADNKDEKKKEQEAKEEVEYSGIYKERQLIPDAMAVHCEMNAEDVVKDMSRLEGCMRKYITDMHNDNASEASEGKQVYNVLRFNVLSDALKKGIAKAAAVNGYETAMNNYAEAGANAKTEFDSEANISNMLAFATDVQNSIRDLYVESLRIEAINGFGEVDPVAFADEEKSEKAKSVEESEKKSDSNVTNVDTTVEIGGEGEKIDADDADEDVIEGEELSEVVVTGNTDAKEYINKFREMSDSRLVQQRAQYESIINDSTTNDEMKKEAENMLRYIEYIEQERNGSAETTEILQNNTQPKKEKSGAQEK